MANFQNFLTNLIKILLLSPVLEQYADFRLTMSVFTMNTEIEKSYRIKKHQKDLRLFSF